jgi:hypothetical protein
MRRRLELITRALFLSPALLGGSAIPFRVTLMAAARFATRDATQSPLFGRGVFGSVS